MVFPLDVALAIAFCRPAMAVEVSMPDISI